MILTRANVKEVQKFLAAALFGNQTVNLLIYRETSIISESVQRSSDSSKTLWDECKNKAITNLSAELLPAAPQQFLWDFLRFTAPLRSQHLLVVAAGLWRSPVTTVSVIGWDTCQSRWKHPPNIQTSKTCSSSDSPYLILQNLKFQSDAFKVPVLHFLSENGWI